MSVPTIRLVADKLAAHAEGRDREILERLGCGETLQQIGDYLGISRERVRQLAEKAAAGISFVHEVEIPAVVPVRCRDCGKEPDGADPRAWDGRTVCPDCRNQRQTDLRGGGRRQPSLIRFWQKVEIHTDLDACWPWTAAAMPHGLPRFLGNGKVSNGRRWIVKQLRGVPEGKAVYSDCQVDCCNPRHLRVGTMVEVMQARDQRREALRG